MASTTKPSYIDWYSDAHSRIMSHIQALKDDPGGETDAGREAQTWIDLGLAREDILLHAHAANLCGKEGLSIQEGGGLVIPS
jgi:hypothetical protein